MPSAWILAGLLACSVGAHAERGKLLLTGGVSTIDGAAGGGLTPWAVTGSYATDGENGATAFVTAAPGTLPGTLSVTLSSPARDETPKPTGAGASGASSLSTTEACA